MAAARVRSGIRLGGHAIVSMWPRLEWVVSRLLPTPAMSKYASLPDIDTAPDVYETPDLPTIHITERDDDSDNEALPAGSHAQQHKGTASSDIIKDTLDQSSARKKFGSASGLDAANADFSGSLLRKQPRRSSARYPPPTTRRTFDTDQYSILPRGYAIDHHPGVLEHETPLERLRRLRFEVDQLEEELEQEKPSPDSVAAQPDDHGDGQSDSAPPPTSTLKGKARAAPTPTELLVELQHLRQQLEKLAVSAASSDPLSTSESQLRAREAYAKSLLHQLTQRGPKAQEASASQPAEPVPPAVSRATACAQLDTRLSVLEDLLGSRSLLQASGTGDITLPPPLLVTIGKLEHQLSLLTQPRHLDSISRRVKVIVTDLERVHEARRKLTDNRPLSIALASGITVVTQAPSGASSQPSVNTSLGNLPGVISGSQDPTQPNLPPDALHKLERLYSLLPRLDPLLPLVPHLLSRLRSLAELHTSAAQFRDRLDLSVADVKHLAARASQLAQLLDLLENNFHANENVIQKNLALVGQRIEKLFESIDLLKSSS